MKSGSFATSVAIIAAPNASQQIQTSLMASTALNALHERYNIAGLL